MPYERMIDPERFRIPHCSEASHARSVMYGAGDVRVEDVPDARLIDPTDALVRVTRAAICGSDLWPYKSLPHDDAGQRMGHEFIGVVEAVGPDVSTIKVDNLVVSPFLWSDGTCVFCREQLHSECLHGGRYGSDDVDGGQGEAVRVPQAEGTLVVLPVEPDDELMPSLLTLTDVMGTGHHAALAAKVGPGTTLAVVRDVAVSLSACRLEPRCRPTSCSAATPPDPLGGVRATDVVRERGDEAVERVRELTRARRALGTRVRRPRAGRRDRARDRPSWRRDRSVACPSTPHSTSSFWKIS